MMNIKIDKIKKYESNTTEYDNDKNAEKWKEIGNMFVKKNNLEDALDAYEKGIQSLDVYSWKNSEHYEKYNSKIKDDIGIELALRSNIGLVLFKMARYNEAEKECSYALDLKPDSSKVLFRRALAREKLSPPNLLGAASDLNECMKYRKSNDAINALNRIEEKIKRSAHTENKRTSNTEESSFSDNETFLESKFKAESPSSSSSKVLTNGTFHNEKNYQKNIIIKLFAQSMINREGESFFFISTRWWEQWCAYTKILEEFQDNPERWARFLHRSGSIDSARKIIRDNDVSDSESITSSESNYDTKFEDDFYPGPIDNTSIINPYKHSTDYNMLRPHLLWGYHYEVIPREVYFALRSWYGENTPSIHFRTASINEKIILPIYNYRNGNNNIYSNSNTESPSTINRVCFTCHSHSRFKCSRCSSIYYCSQRCQASHWHYHKNSCSQMSRSRNQMDVKCAWNRSGLNNLGNTCFLNSAVQCLAHVHDLSTYFLTNQYIEDLNLQNPLGAGGLLAKSYDKVLKDLFFGLYNAVSPTSLKRSIARFAPRFAGCHQHDAQEFLAYFLDGLHEDLNRAKETKYVEMPNIDGSRVDMQIASAEAWDVYRIRNDSFVMDTFYGQFKSTCVCPKCKKVSVAFETYNHISLEIPKYNSATKVIPIILFRSKRLKNQWNQIPVRYEVVINKQGRIIDLRTQLEKLCGVDRMDLQIGYIYDNAIYDLLRDEKEVCTIQPNDFLAAYEMDVIENSSIDAIITQFIPLSFMDGPMKQNAKFDSIGFPLFTNFDSTLSCREVWQYLWDQVSCFVFQNNEENDLQQIQCAQKMLNIRVVDQQSHANQKHEGPILPRYSSKPILNFLKDFSTDNYLFLFFEWIPGNNLQKLIFANAKFTLIHNQSSSIKPFSESSVQTLDQCFSTFSKPERLDEDNKWYCSSCKLHVRAMKTIQLWKLPNVLIIHLKRFEHEHTRIKLETFVDFPLENLNLNQLCRESFSHFEENHNDRFIQDNIGSHYDLFAVINHYGKMGFGHYTAYARQSNDLGSTKKWYCFDDSNTRGIEPSMVVTPAAYVLFYKRITEK